MRSGSAKAVAALLAMAAPATAHASTYVVMPAPGSMQPPTVLVDHKDGRNQIFICHSLNEVWAGTCKPKTRR